MAFITHSEVISENDLQVGDHILVRRYGILYSHHGIYIGNSQVVHFYENVKGNDNGVILTNIDEFLKSGQLRRKIYKHQYNKEEILQRTRSLLNKKDYNLLTNNCEHIATWCVTGEKKSNQVDRFLAITGSAIIGILATGIAAITTSQKLRNNSRKRNK